jgi:nanoRNase/pAp phosphatase (c-di-AMP/oligoRNAs hydrolase)
MDQSAKQQIIERLIQANNVLVTVSANPSVDQLAACIGFTLLLNKLKKHGTAVFSGAVPSTIEFLKPEDTLESNTDSLRDFIIALDKSKADKLRYKVEDKVVKIFITPYRTSLSEKDLDFSQGDFNVDVVLALGVRERQELDQAIVSHGRILHDATVISVNNHDQGNLGSINWVDLNASSLCEMMVDLGKGLLKNPMDAQMATAFMTGIVAETDRFSNEKTSPRTMSMSAELMSAGANQQLIASKLEPEVTISRDNKPAATVNEVLDDVAGSDGSLQISHEPEKTTSVAEPNNEPTPELSLPEPPMPPIGKARVTDGEVTPSETGSKLQNPSSMVLEPPTRGGHLTANTVPEHLNLDPSTDPLSDPSSQNRPMLSRDSPPAKMDNNPIVDELNTKTLTSIEAEVGSPHIMTPAFDSDPLPEPTPGQPSTEEGPVQENNLVGAREAVNEAIKTSDPSENLAPLAALGSQPVNLDLNGAAPTPGIPQPTSPFSETNTTPEPQNDMPAAPLAMAPVDAGPVGIANVPTMPLPQNPSMSGQGVNPSLPANLVPNTPIVDQSGSGGSYPAPPPPVPPPMMPPNL